MSTAHDVTVDASSFGERSESAVGIANVNLWKRAGANVSSAVTRHASKRFSSTIENLPRRDSAWPISVVPTNTCARKLKSVTSCARTVIALDTRLPMWALTPQSPCDERRRSWRLSGSAARALDVASDIPRQCSSSTTGIHAKRSSRSQPEAWVDRGQRSSTSSRSA